MSDTLTLESARGGVRPFVERVEQNRGLSPADVEEVLQNAVIPVFLLEQLWSTAKEMMDRGVEHGKLVTVLTDLLNMTDRCIQAFAAVQAQATSPEVLAEETRRLMAIRAGVSKLLDWLTAPRPPIDPSKLPPARGGRHAAVFISLDEFKARLRAK
jgi:hypothetical protein